MLSSRVRFGLIFTAAMNYRAWLVDFDGTLYHHKPVKYAMALELVLGGLRAIPTVRRFRHSHEQLRPSGPEHALMGADEPSPYERQLLVTAKDLRQPVSQVRQTVETWMMHRPQKWIRCFRRRALLRELVEFQAEGGLLALVSDYPLRSKLSAFHGVPQMPQFDAVIASGEVGGPSALKPSPIGYLAAASALGVTPEECLVIGDRLDADGAAAKAAGMDFRHIR